MSTEFDKPGILLMNTGSPDSPSVSDTRRYLRQFLSDPRVIDMNRLARWLLLNLVILPFRPKHSAEAYQSIWTDEGSPLIVHSQVFCDQLISENPNLMFEIGMAYGKPSIMDSVQDLLSRGATRIILVPMFPQYASATVGSVLDFAYSRLSKLSNVPPIDVLPPFYEAPEFLDAWARIAGRQLETIQPDHVVVSFHGLPERHIRDCDPTGANCLKNTDCCDHYKEHNPSCYKAHCVATTKGLVERLGLKKNEYTLAFQSKLGRDPWITPATDATLVELAQQGTKKVAVLCPAFVADCIETIEEIGMQGKDSFVESGGQSLHLISSLNSEPEWVKAFSGLLKRSFTL
jgi:ferrochelatase